MPKSVNAFACSFDCGRRLTKSRSYMTAHEKVCFHNPERRACQTCAHFSLGSDTVYNPYHGGNPGSTDFEVNFNYCFAKEEELKERQFNCPQWEPSEAIRAARKGV